MSTTEYGTLPDWPELSPCLCGSKARYYQCCKKHPDRRFLVQLLFGDGLEVFAPAAVGAKQLAVVDAAEANQMQRAAEDEVMGRVLIHDDPRRFLFVPKGVWSQELRERFPVWIALERIGFHLMSHPAEAVKLDAMIAPPGPRGLALAMAAQGEHEVYTYLRLIESRERKEVLTANALALELRIDFNAACAILDEVSEKIARADATPDGHAASEPNGLLALPDMDEATKAAGPPMSLEEAIADTAAGVAAELTKAIAPLEGRTLTLEVLDEVAERAAEVISDEAIDAFAAATFNVPPASNPVYDPAAFEADPIAAREAMPADVRAGLDNLLAFVADEAEREGLIPVSDPVVIDLLPGEFESCNGEGLEVVERDGAIELDFPPQHEPKGLDEDTEHAIASRTRQLARELAFALYKSQVGLDASVVKAAVMDILREYDSVAAEYAEVNAVQGEGEVTVTLDVPPDSPLVVLMRAASRLLNEAGALDTPTIGETVITGEPGEAWGDLQAIAERVGLDPVQLAEAVSYAVSQHLRAEIEGKDLDAQAIAAACGLTTSAQLREVLRLALYEAMEMPATEREARKAMIAAVLPCREFSRYERFQAVVALLAARGRGEVLAWDVLAKGLNIKPFEAARLGLEAVAFVDELIVKLPTLYQDAMAYWGPEGQHDGWAAFLDGLEAAVSAWKPEGGEV